MSRIRIYKVFSCCARPASPSSCSLTWALTRYGYRGRDCRSNLYLLPTGEIVYFNASVVVLYNTEEQQQRHYLGHNDDVKWWERRLPFRCLIVNIRSRWRDVLTDAPFHALVVVCMSACHLCSKGSAERWTTERLCGRSTCKIIQRRWQQDVKTFVQTEERPLMCCDRAFQQDVDIVGTSFRQFFCKCPLKGWNDTSIIQSNPNSHISHLVGS